MKIYKLSLLAIAGLFAASCSDIDDLEPQGNGLSGEQLVEVSEAVPSRAEATFAGMFTMMGNPYTVYGASSGRADDFGFISTAISLDVEGPDAIYPNSGYNWFSVCGEYTSRTASYANPYMRYALPYNQIKVANDILLTYGDRDDADAINHIAQARALRAFDYLALVQYFQFNYQIAKDKPAVPLVTLETADPGTNPRATVAEVFEQILSDLDYAIENLTDERSDKTRVNQQVAYGLRARANLIMGNYAEAAADAEKAAAGYTPYSLAEVSTPAFFDIKDHSWIWGIDITTDAANNGAYATSSSWLCSFSSNGYAPAVGVYCQINNLLYNKIPDTDVRKGWWVDENLHSPLLSTISWAGATGDDISLLAIDDVKMEFLPYTNVKFGMMSGIGSEVNDNDFPLMRVEEMLLIQAEGYAKSGQEDKARRILTDFVRTYRDPDYVIPTSRSLADEIWFQRRVELWGEGFAMSDIMRLQKPVVRFHDPSTSNQPEDYCFNIAPTDGWLLMRFPQSEMNTNAAIVDNKEGTLPKKYQNPELRDGVTD